MYLLNTSTYTLYEFQDGSLPPYAILSHRWEEQEVTFRDMQNKDISRTKGFAKMKGCCGQALADGWQFVWIDTCCIDKSSSAELSEAINSMYKWYQNAQVCYVYLSDVPLEDEDPRSGSSAFCNSKWFTRGWTLQELLAPSIVIFFNSEWVEIGTKRSLYDTVSSITGVQPLLGFEKACIAQKMSWISRRKTSRVEDMAYCMMGLFSVNMPPLYGEGERAFLRLQLEILNNSDDESIFAWDFTGVYTADGLLASNPSYFWDAGDVRRHDWISRGLPFSMTNKGMLLELLLLEDHEKNTVAPLNCKLKSSPDILAIRLARLKDNYFEAIRPGLPIWKLPPHFDSTKMKPQIVYVQQNTTRIPNVQSPEYMLIKCHPLLERGFSTSNPHPKRGSVAKFDQNSKSWKIDNIANRRLNHTSLELGFIFTKETRESILLIIQGNYAHGNYGIRALNIQGDYRVESMIKASEKRDSETGSQIFLDREAVTAGDDLSVSFSLKRRQESNRIFYVVDITAKENLPTGKADAPPDQTQELQTTHNSK